MILLACAFLDEACSLFLSCCVGCYETMAVCVCVGSGSFYNMEREGGMGRGRGLEG
jgi:hypothetical protein